jgi:hypothetical protein
MQEVAGKFGAGEVKGMLEYFFGSMYNYAYNEGLFAFFKDRARDGVVIQG